MKLEVREVPGLEVRADGDDGAPVLLGRGIPYGEWSSDLGGFRERFAPSAMRVSVAEDDVRALYNHNPDLVLGRKSRGTLRLEEREDGVHYEVDVNPDDVDAMSAVARVRRGDVDGNSFGFFVEREDDQEWEERDGTLWRTVHRARLRELGPQTFPAYPVTDVSVRSTRAVLEDARRWLERQGRPVALVREILELDEADARLRLRG